MVIERLFPKRRSIYTKHEGTQSKINQTVINVLGVDSPFFSTIVLFKNRLFPLGFDGFLKRFGSLERMEMEGTPRNVQTNASVPHLPSASSAGLASGSRHCCQLASVPARPSCGAGVRVLEVAQGQPGLHFSTTPR